MSHLVRRGCAAACQRFAAHSLCCSQRTHVRAQCSPSEDQGYSRSATTLDETEAVEGSLAVPRAESHLPFSFTATVASLGFVITAYLTWSKLTNSNVTCPITGCDTVLNSPYAQVGPLPLSALGMLGYGTVSFLSYYSIFITPVGEQQLYDRDARALAVTSSGVTIGSCVLAGTSVALGALLVAKFPGATCLYCLASIAASFALCGACMWRGAGTRRKEGAWAGVATTLLALTLASTVQDNPAAARSYDVAFSKPVVTMASPQGAKDLASRLRDAGAEMYGAFWCSHCFEQKQAFGSDAEAALPYVECYPNGYKGPQSISRKCVDAKIQGFPTWIINGNFIEGDWPLAYLEEVLDGADPKEAAKRY